MRKHINKIFMGALLAGTAILASCGSDYLDTVPTESISDENAVATTENAYKTLNGVAKTMTIQQPGSSPSTYRQGFCGENAIMRLYENLPSQNYNYNSYASGWADIHNQRMHTSRTTIYNHYAWFYYYQIITQANVIINRIDNATGPEADKKFIKASALTFRAYGYEKLIHYYCPRWQDSNNGAAEGVVLRLDESNGDLAPSTMAEVYTQIYQDLDNAINLFRESGINRKAEQVWIPNINVAHAVYARAALYKQDYSKALAEATAAKANYPLMSNDSYKAGFCNPTSEWIWGCYGSSDENNWYWSYGVQGACNGYYAAAANTGAGSIGRELINRIPDGDVRKELFLTESALGIDASNPLQVEQTYGIIGYNLNTDPVSYSDSLAHDAAKRYIEAHQIKGLPKAYESEYYHIDGQLKFWVTDRPGVGYLPLIRTSEMVLIEAEANYFLGNTAAAQAALVELNATSGRNPSYTCTKTGQDLFEEIKDYREVELWGEGHGWSDYKRWNIPVVRHSFAQGGNAHVSVAVTIQPNEANNWTWVIPERETLYNDGYSILDENANP